MGVGLFFSRIVQVAACDWHDPDIKFIKPYAVRGLGHEFILIPVWANNASQPKVRYVGQVWQFLEKYGQHLVGREVLLLGDVQIEVYEEWMALSDHCPVICTFDSARLPCMKG
jgi:exonuclease III